MDCLCKFPLDVVVSARLIFLYSDIKLYSNGNQELKIVPLDSVKYSILSTAFQPLARISHRPEVIVDLTREYSGTTSISCPEVMHRRLPTTDIEFLPYYGPHVIWLIRAAAIVHSHEAPRPRVKPPPPPSIPR